MNARESLAADREAEAAFGTASAFVEGTPIVDPSHVCVILLLRAIAAELRAQRVYANYLEGRAGSRTNEKLKAWREE